MFTLTSLLELSSPVAARPNSTDLARFKRFVRLIVLSQKDSRYPGNFFFLYLLCAGI